MIEREIEEEEKEGVSNDPKEGKRTTEAVYNAVRGQSPRMILETAEGISGIAEESRGLQPTCSPVMAPVAQFASGS